MILVDTSIWVDHLREGRPALRTLLDGGRVLGHPWVLGELALGQLGNREEILRLLAGLPQAAVASMTEVLALIDGERLFGLGVGYVDVQLLAATRLTPDAALWTGDRRLHSAAATMGVAADPAALVIDAPAELKATPDESGQPKQ